MGISVLLSKWRDSSASSIFAAGTSVPSARFACLVRLPSACGGQHTVLTVGSLPHGLTGRVFDSLPSI